MVLRSGVLVQPQRRKNTEAVIMGNNTPNSKLAETAADQSLIDGLNTIASAIPSFVVGGATVPTKDIVTTLQARLVTAKAAESARATWRTAVQADRDERAKTATGSRRGIEAWPVHDDVRRLRPPWLGSSAGSVKGAAHLSMATLMAKSNE
jgi:hypothetical protein